MKQFKYRQLLNIGTTQYYDQTHEDREALAGHISKTIGTFSERGAGFSDDRDWKMYNQELGESLKWARGRHPHNPSVRCLWAQFNIQMHTYYGNVKARFSKIQIDNFNRSVTVASKLYNTNTVDVHKVTADHFKIEMIQEADDAFVTNNKYEDLFVKALKN